MYFHFAVDPVFEHVRNQILNTYTALEHVSALMLGAEERKMTEEEKKEGGGAGEG